MDLLESIDNYCERTDASLLSEPVNAITNLSFLVAAWMLWKLYRRQGRSSRGALLLIALVASVGLGSLAFHTFGQRWAMLADIIPIGIFIYTYLWLGLRYLFRLSYSATVLWLMAFVLFSYATGFIPSDYSFNGSIMYLPPLVAVLGFALACSKRLAGARKAYFLAFGCFMFSLGFRSLDMRVCVDFALGTHFMWHLLNGVLLYLLVRNWMVFTLTPQK